MEVITYEIQQQVRVRKYRTDCKKLCDFLRKHKKMASLSNKEIAKTLNMPITKVEHWFRQDSCFSIPDECIWFELKKLLKITNNEFDLAITTFEEKNNVFEKGNRIYDSQGICPTITCLDSLVILDRSNEMEVKVIGQMDNTIDHTFESANRVYDVGGVAPTMNTCGGGGLQPKILESQIVAMRGRNPDNPSDRTVGSPTEQRLEINMQGTSNCLTSVQKDNLLLKKPQYRIRKLTPRECGRLMGVSDEDIDKMAAVNSNTQLYKQFGNSIVVDVMCAMFKNLNISQK